MEKTEGLTPEQIEQIEHAYQEGLEEVDREDAQHVLAKEKKARRKAGDLIKQHAGSLVLLGKQVLLLYDMLRAWWDGRHPLPWRTVAAITAALLYFVNPFDIVPDFIPVIGYLDDVVVIGACMKLIQPDLRAYAESKKLNLADYGLN